MAKAKKMEEGSGRYRVTRWCGGISAGLHGIVCYERLADRSPPANVNAMHGLNPEGLVGELGEGAEIEVQVRVVRKGLVKHNPWVRPDGGPNYRATRGARNGADVTQLDKHAFRRYNACMEVCMEERQVSVFDRALGMLDGLTGVSRTSAATKVVVTPIIGRAATYIVQTYRQRDEAEPEARSRDTVFLQYLADGETYRIVIPSEVADIIARQRDALGTKSRKRAAKQAAEKRKAEGFVPFVRKGRSELRRQEKEAKSS